MSEREAFVRKIAEQPDNDLTRLVFADWLEEKNECQRAAMMRYEINPTMYPLDEIHRKFDIVEAASVFGCNVEKVRELAVYIRGEIVTLRPVAALNVWKHLWALAEAQRVGGIGRANFQIRKGSVWKVSCDIGWWAGEELYGQAVVREHPVQHVMLRDVTFAEPDIDRVVLFDAGISVEVGGGTPRIPGQIFDQLNGFRGREPRFGEFRPCKLFTNEEQAINSLSSAAVAWANRAVLSQALVQQTSPDSTT